MVKFIYLIDTITAHFRHYNFYFRKVSIGLFRINNAKAYRRRRRSFIVFSFSIKQSLK